MPHTGTLPLFIPFLLCVLALFRARAGLCLFSLPSFKLGRVRSVQGTHLFAFFLFTGSLLQ